MFGFSEISFFHIQGLPRKSKLLLIISLCLCVVLGTIYIWYQTVEVEKTTTENALKIAKVAEAALDKNLIQKLEASPQDIGKEQYILIKSSLMGIANQDKQIRFAYLYTERDGKLVFLADSEPENSKDYSPPGQEYTEAQPVFKKPFRDGLEAVTETYSDRWGTWKSILIPIKDTLTGKVTAVFGIDYPSNIWNKNILTHSLEASAIVLSVILLLLTFFNIWENNRKLSKSKDILKKSEEKFSSAFHSSSALMIISKISDGSIIDVNKKLLNTLGFSREEVIGKSTLDLKIFAEKKDRDNIKTIYEKNGKVTDLEISIFGKNGIKINSILSIAPIEIDSALYWLTSIIDITMQKQAEGKLRESEERFRSFIENANDIIYSITPDGIFTYVSPNWMEMRGYEASEAIGQSVETLMHPDDFPKFHVFLKKVAASVKKQGEIEYRLKHATGKWFWYASKISAIYNADGKFVSYFGIARDITDRRQAEESLQKNEELLRNIIEFSHSASYKRNLKNNKYDYISPVIEKITGYKPQEIINMSLSAINEKIHPDDLTNLTLALKKAYKSSNPNIFVEYRFLCKDGNYRWFADRSILVKEDLQKPLFSYGAIEDINEKKIIEIKLNESENRLKIATNGAKIGLWDWAVQEGEVVFNEQWAEMLGYTLEELAPTSIKTWIKLSHPDDLKKSDELLKKTFSGELEYYECEARMKHKNGEWIWVLDRGQVIEWDKNKNPIRMAGTHINIDRIKKQEEVILTDHKKIEKMNQKIIRINHELKHAASTDRLTGAWNRRHFEKIENIEIEKSRRSKQHLALLMIDIDNFKNINDIYGHQMGDQILIEIISLIQANIRETDILARWGGDELVLLVSNLLTNEAVSLAEKLRCLVEEHNFQTIGTGIVTISVGISEFRNEDNSDTLIKMADDALYTAKIAGRNIVKIAEPGKVL